MNYEHAIAIIAAVLFGIPFAALIFFVCRRLYDLRRESRYAGTIYLNDNHDAYLELDNEEAFSRRFVVLRVKKLKGGSRNGKVQTENNKA